MRFVYEILPIPNIFTYEKFKIDTHKFFFNHHWFNVRDLTILSFAFKLPIII